MNVTQEETKAIESLLQQEAAREKEDRILDYGS